MEEKLQGHKTIEFQYLGPSPFHADFFVARSETAERAEKDISLSGAGYRTLFFEYPERDDQLVDAFVALNHDILSRFYHVVRYRNRSMHLGSNIADGTQSLIASSRSPGRPAIWRWFRHGPIIDNVYKSILDQKMNNIALADFLAEANADETIDQSSVIYQFIKRYSKDQFAVPTDDVKDILKMLEDRRQGYIRNTTTLMSGLIGGILGASLTFLLGFYAANSKSTIASPRSASPPFAAPQNSTK